MEIIADVDNSTKLVKVSMNELALLRGFTSMYDSGFDRNDCHVGKVIDIAKMVKTSEYIKNLNTKLLKSMKEQLDNASAGLAIAIESADEMNCFEKLKG